MINVILRLLTPFALAGICALLVVHVVHALVPAILIGALGLVAMVWGIQGLYIWSVMREGVGNGR